MNHRLILLQSLLLFCAQGQAQDSATPTTIYSCDLLRDCLSCMVNGTDCVFSAGVCSTECTDNGASCYSKESHPNLDVNGICDLYNSDNLKCTSQTSCLSCVATAKSDLGLCKWYPLALSNMGACFGGGTGPYGSGEIECDAGSTTEPPTPSSVTATVAPKPPTTVAPAPTDPPATNPPVASSVSPTSTNTDPEAFCQAASADCQTCLEANCAWFPNVGQCAPDCSSLADTDCYSTSEKSTANTTQHICTLVATASADRELCFAQQSCESCLETNKSDGSACQWYTDADNGLSWCEVGECNSDGICGESTCDVVVDETDELPSTEGVNGTHSNATSNTTTPANDGPCAKLSGRTCAACLASPEGCAWSIDTCLSSCDNIADAPCVHANMRPNMSAPEICNAAVSIQQENELCSRRNYCFTCTSTLQSDGVTKCAWYNDNAGNEWCGIGGCDMNGVCGQTDENVCQFPTDPPFTSAPAIDLTFPPTVSSTGTPLFSRFGSLVIVVPILLVLGGIDVV